MKATDYTDFGNWLYFDTERLHEADLLYFYPTMLGGNGSDMVTEICDEMREKAGWIAGKQAAYLRGFTNVFAPLYRQLGDRALAVARDEEKILGVMKASEVREDVYAALELYFKRINQGRPFILAGHSQGAIVLLMILSDYMKEHPDLLKRMVAAYAIGYGVTETYLKKNPHLRFAEGKTDTGVIISWNTEGPDSRSDCLVLPEGSIAINPLNWKRDGTYASVKENRGSLEEDPGTLQNRIVTGRADARVDLSRGSLVCTTVTDYLPKGSFGDQGLHNGDWVLYLENIRQNMFDRITAYLRERPLPGKAMDYDLRENWMFCEVDGPHPVDLFYLYPTVINGGDGKQCEAPDELQKDAARLAFSVSGSTLENTANVFAPFYRQITLEAAKTANTGEQYADLLRSHEGISDVFAALDRYFEDCNHGRPFILAGQEQGSALLSFVLDEYMKNHPEYLDRMIAAYVPGFRFTREYFEKNPQLKAAQGETDTGVIVSWNMEGPEEGTHPGAKQKNAGSDGAAVINPLNWRTDGTPAAASENTGSMVHRPYSNLWSRVPGYADARIDTERCVLISQVRGRNWALYYGNIGINAEKRIRKYLCSRTDIPTESRRSLS